MKLQDGVKLSAPVQPVWALVSNPIEIGTMIPGVESVTQEDDERYVGTLVVNVGPLKSKFHGHFSYQEMTAPSFAKAKVEGKDAITGSVVRATVCFHLSALSPSETDVSYDADVTIVGKLGMFGDGVIQDMARLMLEEFSRNLQARLDGEKGTAPQSSSFPTLAVLRSLITGTIKTLLARLKIL